MNLLKGDHLLATNEPHPPSPYNMMTTNKDIVDKGCLEILVWL